MTPATVSLHRSGYGQRIMGSGAPLLPEAGWVHSIPPAQWAVYDRVLATAERAGIRFALGGAFAYAWYTSQFRDTKDMDCYVLPGERAAMIDVLTAAGLEDLFPQNPYDRGWIYRGVRAGTVVDIIDGFPNYRAELDERWVTGGPIGRFGETPVRLIPPEELIWAKLYVFQRGRCDWPDILNLLYEVGPRLAWRHLISRLGEDLPLLTAALAILRWLAPGRAASFPPWVWRETQLDEGPLDEVELSPLRVRLLESRPWFIPLMRQRGEV